MPYGFYLSNYDRIPGLPAVLLLLTSFLGSCSITYQPLALSTAPHSILAAKGNCAGDWLKARFKNGTESGEFMVCAVTDTYVEPCCLIGNKRGPCPKPKRLKFADVVSLERMEAGTWLARCATKLL